jgi:hypothetical protein
MRNYLPLVCFGLFLLVYPWRVLKTNDFYRIQVIKNHDFTSDSVIIGDSRLRNLKLKGYQNLSIAGIGMPEMHEILKQIVSNRPTLSKVVICLDPEHLMNYNHFEVLQRDNPIPKEENLSIQRMARTYGDSLYLIKEKSFMEKIRFFGLIGEISTRIRMPLYIFRDFKEYYFSNGDYLCHSKKNSAKPKADERNWKLKKPSPVNQEYGKQLFKLLSNTPNIEVIWVIPDRYGQYHSSFVNEYKGWIESMGGKPQWRNMADVVSNEDFFDQKHLNCNGLEKVGNFIVN